MAVTQARLAIATFLHMRGKTLQPIVCPILEAPTQGLQDSMLVRLAISWHADCFTIPRPRRSDPRRADKRGHPPARLSSPSTPTPPQATRFPPGGFSFFTDARPRHRRMSRPASEPFDPAR